MYGQYMPIIMLTVATFTLIEAAGAADEYPALKGTSKVMVIKKSLRIVILIKSRLRRQRPQFVRGLF